MNEVIQFEAHLNINIIRSPANFRKLKNKRLVIDVKVSLLNKLS